MNYTEIKNQIYRYKVTGFTEACKSLFSILHFPKPPYPTKLQPQAQRRDAAKAISSEIGQAGNNESNTRRRPQQHRAAAKRLTAKLKCWQLAIRPPRLLINGWDEILPRSFH
jgi:hypothetical protein